jgi:hypothetical protein
MRKNVEKWFFYIFFPRFIYFFNLFIVYHMTSIWSSKITTKYGNIAAFFVWLAIFFSCAFDLAYDAFNH